MIIVAPEDVGVSSERLARLNSVMQRYVDENKLAGIVTLLARDGQVFHFERFGMADIEAKKPMELDSLFRIFSMTKPIASVALMMLYEEGRFHLEDPVTSFIPEFEGLKVYAGMGQTGMRLDELKHQMTIRHLLTHTSGLSYGFYEDSPVEAMYREADTRSAGSSLKDMIQKLSKLPLLYQPGTEWRYSVATDVVGYLVEVMSGQRFDDFLEERILSPLGMESTGFYAPEEEIGRLGAVYGPPENGGGLSIVDNAETSRFARPTTFFSGGGGLVSTAGDYFRFCQMMLNQGELDGVRLLGRKTVELMTVNHLSEDLLPFSVGEAAEDYAKGCGFGLGFRVVMDVAQTGVVGSEGSHSWGGAASTTFWIDPEEELIAIFMTQFMPSGHYPIHREFQALTYQAIVD